jgi:hypothetical protein
MVDEEHDDTTEETDDDLPEGIVDLRSLSEDIEQEYTEMKRVESEIRTLLGGGSSPERVAILKIFDLLINTVMPIISTQNANITDAIMEVLEVVGSDESTLVAEDAQLISSALVAAAQIVAVVESESEGDRLLQCQAVGELVAKALTRVKEITVEEDDETHEETG